MKKSLFGGKVVDLWSLVGFILMNSGQPLFFKTRTIEFDKRTEVYYHDPTKCFLLFEYKCPRHKRRDNGTLTAFGREESIQQLEELHQDSHLPLPASQY